MAKRRSCTTGRAPQTGRRVCSGRVRRFSVAMPEDDLVALSERYSFVASLGCVSNSRVKRVRVESNIGDCHEEHENNSHANKRQ